MSNTGKIINTFDHKGHSVTIQLVEGSTSTKHMWLAENVKTKKQLTDNSFYDNLSSARAYAIAAIDNQ